MRFLADVAVVMALRNAGHDVTAVAEINPGAEDEAVLGLARSEARVVLTEDKDFGLLAYAGGQRTAGVILTRFPAGARSSRGQAVVNVVSEFGSRLAGACVVVEPGRARHVVLVDANLLCEERERGQPNRRIGVCHVT